MIRGKCRVAAVFAVCAFLAGVVFPVLWSSITVCAAEETTAESEQMLKEKTEENILGEFDFSEIDESLSRMFPEQKMKFREVVLALVSKESGKTGEILMEFVMDQVFYEFKYNRENLVYVLLIAVIAAVFSNFSSAFQNKQVSEISFYVLYMLLIAMCLNTFRIAVEGAQSQLNLLLEFMQVLCPSYFLAVAIASGSTSSLFFYNAALFLIYVAEVLVLRFLLPMIQVYLMVEVLSNLTGEAFLSQFAQLIQKLVAWSLKSLLACVVGMNVVEGLLAPAIDTLQRGVLSKTAEAIPGLGNTIGSVTDMVLGTAVLIKNGIGMAGAVIAVSICVVPVIQTLVLSLLYKAAAAVVQPISDKRITACIGSVSEGYELLMKLICTTGILFLLTIAVVAASTS